MRVFVLLQVINELYALALKQKAATEQEGETRNGNSALNTRPAKTRTRDVVLRRDASGGLCVRACVNSTQAFTLKC